MKTVKPHVHTLCTHSNIFMSKITRSQQTTGLACDLVNVVYYLIDVTHALFIQPCENNVSYSCGGLQQVTSH